MNIDERLENFLSNNSIYQERKVKSEKIKESLKKLFHDIPNETNVAFRGGGEHTEELIEYIPENINVVCIIDKNKFCLTCGNFKIIDIDEINNYNIDLFIISSYEYRKEMISELKGLNKEIVDIYDYLSLNGINLDGCFYKYDDSAIDYEQIIELKEKYYTENNVKLKELYLEEIIINCILVKDFISAIKFINMYIYNKYSKIDEYRCLLNSINSMIEDIKMAFSKRKHKDIIMFWLDELSYNEVDEMPYLSSLINDSMFFTKAYTTTIATKGVFKAIFQKKMNIDDFSTTNEKFNKDNSNTLRAIIKNGYKFKFISHEMTGASLFEDEFCVKTKNLRRLSGSSKKLWALIKLLLETEEPVFAITHILKETHLPFHSLDLEYNQLQKWNMPDYLIKGKSDYENQIKISRNYIDKQIQFYSELMNYNCSKIYMSDHGKREDLSKPMSESKIHVLLMIIDKNIKHKKIDDIFSVINYFELFNYIFAPSEDTYNKMLTNKYVLYQELDTYNEERVRALINADKVLPGAFAMRGIISEKDKYAKTRYGEEFYYLVTDDKNNLIRNKEYIERINSLRELAGNDYVDIYQYEIFKYSKLLYEFFNLY